MKQKISIKNKSKNYSEIKLCFLFGFSFREERLNNFYWITNGSKLSDSMFLR